MSDVKLLCQSIRLSRYLRVIAHGYLRPSLSSTGVTENIGFEFSSPNIAKELHYGHLRSTLIGNVCSNLASFTGQIVTKINYIGDWGFQYALLAAALQKWNLNSVCTIDFLSHIYSEANRMVETNHSEFIENARLHQQKLESKDEQAIKLWRKVREISLHEVVKIYKLLNIAFDHWQFESDFFDDVVTVLNHFRENDTLKIIGGAPSVEIQGKVIPLGRADGTSIYLCRDIVAALQRHDSFSFNKLYYVVENSQTNHLKNLKNCLHLINVPAADMIHHLKFGRVVGLSSRKGAYVPLKEIISQAIDKVKNTLKIKETTKTSDFEETSKHLAISALTVALLSHKRGVSFQFNLEDILHFGSKSGLTAIPGITFQYTHARLCSLIEKNSDLTTSRYCPYHLLVEKEAVDLYNRIQEFESCVQEAADLMEPSVLITYSNNLCSATNVALRSLRVKGAVDKDTAEQRLTLFYAARNRIRQCLELLGLKPLDQM